METAPAERHGLVPLDWMPKDDVNIVEGIKHRGKIRYATKQEELKILPEAEQKKKTKKLTASVVDAGLALTKKAGSQNDQTGF